MKVKEYISTPVRVPTSCSFCGENMDILVITTASYGCDLSENSNAGYTALMKTATRGRKPYLFG